MGKQSRRKKGVDKEAKKVAKEEKQQQQFLEQQHAKQQRNKNDFDIDGSEELAVGRRVCFEYSTEDSKATGWSQGIVKEVKESSCHLLPIQDAEGCRLLSVEHESAFVMKDTLPWTLRFEQDDEVVFFYEKKNCWISGIVIDTWPIRRGKGIEIQETNHVLFYRVSTGESRAHLIHADADARIRKIPESFRFSKGDSVVISSGEARGITNRKRDPWIRGKISDVNVLGELYYAFYKCTFMENGKRRTCYIVEDDDQHVASISASPRERLMEAIEQDCDYDHIDYLCTGMDVMPFRDILLAHAIEHASYHALAWLQNNALVELHTIRDSDRNGLLHQIAKGRHAERFVLTAVARLDREFHKTTINLLSLDVDDDDRLLLQRNSQGRLWLHELIISGNLRAFELALSPTGLLWIMLTRMRWDKLKFEGLCDMNGLNLKDTARLLGRNVMVKIVDKADEISVLNKLQHEVLSRCEHLCNDLSTDAEERKHSDSCVGIPDLDTLNEVDSDSASLMAKRLVRFSRDYGTDENDERPDSLEDMVGSMAEALYIRALSWVVVEDATMLGSVVRVYSTGTRQNNNEFGQPELYTDARDGDEKLYLNPVAQAIRGQLTFYSFENYLSNRNAYFAFLKTLIKQSAGSSKWTLISDLEWQLDMIPEEEDDFHMMVKYKLDLLQDDKILKARLKMLDYLVKDKGQNPPNVLNVIRWRQCGVLRWMLRSSYINLGAPAREKKSREGRFLKFLGGRKTPHSMTVGVFLCFAAIEFDDQQSLQWLVQDNKIPLSQIVCHGWNAVHCSAYFGRIEIFLWLRSLKTLKPLVAEPCSRKPYEGALAAHMAVSQGHVFLADLLLSSGCPVEDSTGKSVCSYAEQSEHAFVQEWGKEREKPSLLEKDIRKLRQLLSSKKATPSNVTKFISESGCMETNRWVECGFATASEPGPCGKSYRDVLAECCKITFPDYIVSLCQELMPSRHFASTEQKRDIEDLFWNISSTKRTGPQLIGLKALKTFAEKRNDEVACHYLEQPWTKGIQCEDPSQCYHVLRELLTRFRADSSVSVALGFFRDRLLRLDLMMKIRAAQMDRVKKKLIQGARPVEVEEEITKVIEITTDLAKGEGQPVQICFSHLDIVLPSGKVNIECELDCGYGDHHPLSKTAKWHSTEESAISKLHLFLAIEDYPNLIAWSRVDNNGIWDVRKEADVVRIASYFGHTEIVNTFLPNPNSSSKDALVYAALLGCAEAGRADDIASCLGQNLSFGLPSDEFVNDFERRPLLGKGVPWTNWTREKSDLEERRLAMQRNVASSLVGSIVYASLQAWNQSNVQEPGAQVSDVHREVIKLLVSKSVVDVRLFVRAGAKILLNLRALHCYERCDTLIKYLLDDCNLDIWTCQEELRQISEAFLCFYYFTSSKKIDCGRLHSLVVRWCELLFSLGCDVNSLQLPSASWIPRANAEQKKSFAHFFESLQAAQRKQWSYCDLVTEGRPVEDIQEAARSGEISLTTRYKQGLLLSHLAAAHDRPEILKWLVNEKGVSLEARDGLGRTVPEVAEQANVENVCDWITHEREMHTVSRFVSSNFRRRRAMRKAQHTLRRIILTQAMQRGRSVRRTYSSLLVSRLEETARFQGVWKRSIDAVCKSSFESGGDFCWKELKHAENDIMQADLIDDLDEFTETAQILGEAVTQVAPREEIEEDNDDGCGGEDGKSSLQDILDENDINCVASSIASDVWQPTCNVKSIKMTKEVVKWLRHGDNKYRTFFVRRMEQLAAGERSRILAKRLTGCETTIYETYLEQKSGHRILWTESGDSLLIWYVAKHKNVSRLMSLIDDAEGRSKRQLIPASELSEVETTNNIDSESAIEEQIMLDPLSDTPLKLYEVVPDDIEKLNDVNWKPQLYLTSREKEIVETDGTVLVLGRSGTGKTCVICNRMDYDRQRAEGQFGFTQLFVARSHRLCSYVKEVVDVSGTDDASNAASMQFEVFGNVIRTLESILPPRDGTKDLFLPSHKMDYGRFKREVYQPEASGGLDALVVWTNIRSFIKGSIEALTTSSKVLSKNEYLNLGKRRCRLTPEQRSTVYATFERYDAYMNDLCLWDDCDRVSALVQRMEHARSTDASVFHEVRYNKLYVDEVQDYTQAEIALFFYLCGAGDLFLAGDPAQSVVEGVEFRFEEIRSVGYHLYGEDRRHLIPDKPKTVHLNFRSHCGILNVAAAVLSCLFQAFPDSAKQLKEDRGLFQGPRPGVFDKVSRSRLRELVLNRNGIVVLTHDSGVAALRRALDDYPLVYGIREAKGLEFQEVVLVDFFAGVSKPLQKLWRDLLLGRDASHVSQRPEIEGHLKLLYTAVTRCIQRLYFAETHSSVAGDAFVRWLTTTTTLGGNERKDALAIKNSIDEVEKMLRTPDEWRSAGLDNAVIAESSDDLEESEKWLERAIYCFEQVGIQGDTALASRARVHRSSIRFRRDLSEVEQGAKDITQKEVEAARLTENLLHEQLFMEARQVCDAVLQLLKLETQDMLQKHLISKLPSVERDGC